jgi:hypothetical protein
MLSFLGSSVMYHPEVYLNFVSYVDSKGKLFDPIKKLYEIFLTSFKEYILINKTI